MISTAPWVVIVIYLGWSCGAQQWLVPELDPFSRNLIEQGLLTAFFLLHATRYYTGRELGVFALVCIVISNLFENSSVMTGFPFGAFHHSHITGPRLFHIPLLAIPTYTAMGYVSWIVAQALLDRRVPSRWRHDVLPAVVTAALVFTDWDFCNDAVFHSVNRAFFYHHPGPFFGVPASNFLGWLFVTGCFYGVFALYLARLPEQELRDRPDPGLPFWLQAVSMYLAVALAGIYRNLMGSTWEVTLDNGQTWSTADIYASMTLVTIFTMVFVALLAFFRLLQLSDGRDSGSQGGFSSK